MSIFLEEGREALERANDLVVQLEHAPENAELIHELFRTIHSFKGMASTMGFEDLGELAHAIESLLVALREGAIQVQPGLIDVVLHALDALERLLDLAAGGEGEPPAVKLLAAELAVWQVHTRTVPAAEQPRPAPEAAAPIAGGRCYRVIVRLDPACMMKSVQALMISSALETVGHVKEIDPAIEELEWLEPDEPFHLILLTGADAETVAATVTDLADVTELQIEELAAEAEPPIGLDEAQRRAFDQALVQGGQAIRVEVTLDAECMMPGVRAQMVLQTLSEFGEVVYVDPPEAEAGDVGFGDRFRVVLVGPASAERVREAILDIGEIVEVTSRPVDPEAIQAAPPTSMSATVPQAAGPGGDRPAERRSPMVRVSADRLDALMALATELLGERERLIGVAEHLEHPELDGAAARLSDLAERLHGEVLHLRVVPVDSLFKRFGRMVRDLARELEKDVRLELEGGQTEIDRRYGDELGDVLMHLIRNAVDHGLERPADRLAAGKSPEGLVRLSCAQVGQEVVLAIKDDGRGLDLARIRAKAEAMGLVSPGAAVDEPALLEAIFAPGFSTAATATAVSGRGVGMDAVREKLRALGGTIELETRPGKGTTFTMRLPLGIAVVPAMLTGVGGEVYGIPTAAIEEVLPAEEGDLDAVLQSGDRVPLLRLRDRFDVPEAAEPGPRSVVVIRTQRQRIGLLVEQLLGEYEVAVKPLSHFLGDLPGLSGAAPLGDGRIAFLVDPAKL
ncbi:MAG: chemotaxis protein CheW [Candidatus Sericytochromatia bacterium]